MHQNIVPSPETSSLIHLAIFASGRGSNAAAILEYFAGHPKIKIGLILSNKPDAGVLQLAKSYQIPSVVIDKTAWNNVPDQILRILSIYKIDRIILAGFLWLIPDYLIDEYPKRIINIHPALLPKYGGKGMYGQHIHKTISQQGDVKTGITIHLVNARYDEGEILFQKDIGIEPHSSPDEIAGLVLKLEHRYYPEVIEQWVDGEK